jgi:hypothetical protein
MLVVSTVALLGDCLLANWLIRNRLSQIQNSLTNSTLTT